MPARVLPRARLPHLHTTHCQRSLCCFRTQHHSRGHDECSRLSCHLISEQGSEQGFKLRYGTVLATISLPLGPSLTA